VYLYTDKYQQGAFQIAFPSMAYYKGGDWVIRSPLASMALIRQVRGGRFQVKEAKGLGQHILAETTTG